MTRSPIWSVIWCKTFDLFFRINFFAIWPNLFQKDIQMPLQMFQTAPQTIFRRTPDVQILLRVNWELSQTIKFMWLIPYLIALLKVCFLGTQLEFAKLRAFRALLPYMPSRLTCLCALCTLVPSCFMCFCALRALIFGRLNYTPSAPYLRAVPTHHQMW